MRAKHFAPVLAFGWILGVFGAPSEAGAERVDIVREWNEDGTPATDGEVVGWSRLTRHASGLKAAAGMRGLIPDGVYTFWWVVPHELPPDVPFDVFVAGGAAAVAGPDGSVKVRMRSYTGQRGICGFPPIGDLEWHLLTDPLGTPVRIEIAYHGQAEDAGDDLMTWFSDFWTGSACPVDPDTPQGEVQPHCPVYFAATHLP